MMNKIIGLFIGKIHCEQYLSLWYTSWKCLYIIFEKLNSIDCDCEKMEQKYLNGPAFAIVLLRAKHVGAAVIHMQLWTHDKSFEFDLWLKIHWTKSVHFLVENCYSSLNYLNQTY